MPAWRGAMVPCRHMPAETSGSVRGYACSSGRFLSRSGHPGDRSFRPGAEGLRARESHLCGASGVPCYGGNWRNVDSIRDRVCITLADCCDAQVAREAVADQESVFSLAGQTSHIESMEEPAGDVSANCQAPLPILDVCRRCNPEARIAIGRTGGDQSVS